MRIYYVIYIELFYINFKKFYVKILRELSINLYLVYIFEDRGLFLC